MYNRVLLNIFVQNIYFIGICGYLILYSLQQLLLIIIIIFNNTKRIIINFFILLYYIIYICYSNTIRKCWTTVIFLRYFAEKQLKEKDIVT